MGVEEEDSAALADPYAALRLGDFRLLLMGRFLATLGEQMVSVAVGWQLYEITHSALALGMVGLVEMIPVLLLSLPAGHYSDHRDRRRIALATRLGLAISSLALGLLSWRHGPVALIYLCVLAFGAVRAYHNPASTTLLAQIVPTRLYGKAVTWNSNAWQLAAAVGPALGGFLIALSHSATSVYFLDVLLSLAFVALIARTHGEQPVRAREPATFESLAAGIRFLRHSRLLLSAITLDLFAVLFGGATALLPIFAKDILHVGPTGLGWLRAAPSLGAVAMAITLAHAPPFKRAGKTLLVAVAGFGAATIVFGLSRSFPLSLCMLVLLGAMDSISVVVRSTLLLVRAPDEMRGRISAVNSVFVGASNELGGFESGVAASLLGPVAGVVAGGVGTVLVVIFVAAAWPELRNLKGLHDAESPSA